MLNKPNLKEVITMDPKKNNKGNPQQQKTNPSKQEQQPNKGNNPSKKSNW